MLLLVDSVLLVVDCALFDALSVASSVIHTLELSVCDNFTADS